MYVNFLIYEIKKWIRDPFLRFMIVYPVIFGIIGRYVLPSIAESSDFSIDLYADVILVVLALMTPQIYGAIIGFSILDDRDDNILTSVEVTPLSIHQFLAFRLIIGFLFSFIACSFVLIFSDIGNFSISNILTIAFLASFSAPFTGLFINSIAKNKIEGFAIMKGSGVLLVFPIVALMFTDIKELIFAFAPGFWPAKVISVLVRGHEVLRWSYYQYYFIGLIYILVLNVLVYKVFIKKIKQ